jgi:hypothetical protein
MGMETIQNNNVHQEYAREKMLSKKSTNIKWLSKVVYYSLHIGLLRSYVFGEKL